MRRSGAVLALAVLALPFATGCGDSRSNQAAAVVDGTDVSRSDYEDLVRAVAASPELFGIEEDLATGTIAGDAGRTLLTELVLNVARADFLSGAGAALTDADRQAALESLGPRAEEVPEVARTVIVDGQAGRSALGRVAAGAGQAAYEASPADVGVMCVRHILVETEEEAREVLAELDDGADFAELAMDRSTEPAAATTGGAIELQPGQPCIPLEQAQQLDAAFVAGAVEAIPGVPTEPVQTQFGWHVILARPYEEVAAAVDPIIGQRRFAEHLADVEVEIDPRYGRWDADAAAVVALQQPTAETSLPTSPSVPTTSSVPAS